MQRLVIRARTPAGRLTPCLEVHLPILALELAGEKVELTAPAAARGGDDGVSWFLLIFHLSFFSLMTNSPRGSLVGPRVKDEV